MEVKDLNDFLLYLKGIEIELIGNKGIREVIIENKKRGIPLVYSIDNKIYYQLANGDITTKTPFSG